MEMPKIVYKIPGFDKKSLQHNWSVCMLIFRVSNPSLQMLRANLTHNNYITIVAIVKRLYKINFGIPVFEINIFCM